jgi:hypothetical protein
MAGSEEVKEPPSRGYLKGGRHSIGLPTEPEFWRGRVNFDKIASPEVGNLRKQVHVERSGICQVGQAARLSGPGDEHKAGRECSGEHESGAGIFQGSGS